MGCNFGLRWRVTRFCHAGLGSARTTLLPTSDHPPPDSCIDQRHRPRALLIGNEGKLGTRARRVGGASVRRPAQQLRPSRTGAGSPGGCEPGQTLASVSGPRPQPLIGSFAAV